MCRLRAARERDTVGTRAAGRAARAVVRARAVRTDMVEGRMGEAGTAE